MAHLEALKRGLTGDTSGVHVSRWNDGHALIVPVDLPGSDGSWTWRYSTRLCVFFVGDELHAASDAGSASAPLGDAPHLRRVMAALRERMLEQRGRDQKREKIRKLKERSIEAQVEALAARLGFSYALHPLHTKVKLVVRLDKTYALVVDVPYARIQAALAELPPLLDKVRDLHRTGARFKIERCLGHRFRDPRPAS